MEAVAEYRAHALPSWRGLPAAAASLSLSELNLPIDDNPDGTADRKQLLFFTKQRRLGDETSAFAAGFPRRHHASLARTRPPFDAYRKAPEQDRQNVEIPRFGIVLGYVAGRTIQRGPHELRSNQAICGGEREVGRPGTAKAPLASCRRRGPAKSRRPSPGVRSGPQTKHIGSRCWCGLNGVRFAASMASA